MAEGEVTWYWKDRVASGFSFPVHKSDELMDKIAPQGGTDSSVTLSPGERGWWYADKAVEESLTFPVGDWTMTFWAETNSPNDERMYSRVVKVFENGTVEYMTSTSVYENIESSDGIKEITETVTAAGATNLQQGDRIAIEILLSSGAEVGEWLKVYYSSTSHNSRLISPPSSPHYPRVSNRPPPPPALSSPPDGSRTKDQTPAFDWTDATDPDGDPVTYDLQVDDDSGFSSPEIDQSGLASSEYTPGSDLSGGAYYWHARSSDGSDPSDWTSAWTVTVDLTPPGDVTDFTATVGDEQASLSWTNPNDADFKGTMVRYRTDGAYPTSETDGTLVCDIAASPGSSDSCTHISLTNGATYYYTAFPYDTLDNYAPAAASAQDSATPAAAVPGDVLINEVAFDETSDWIGFYVLKTASYQGLRIYRGGSKVEEFPAITASIGDYIVLHFKGDPANDESDATGKGANGYWDVYTNDTGLTATDDVVRIQRVETESVHETDTIDVVIWSNDNGNFTGKKEVANDLVATGHWDAGSDFSSTRDSDAWTDSDDVSPGKSIGRDASSTDTNARADWHLFTSQTPGAHNPTMGTPGDVLINEVAPNEDNDWIEFYNASGNGLNIQYWLVRERSTEIKTLPSYAIAPGEYIVLHFDGDLADDEIAGDTNGNGHRDFYAADTGLIGTDNVIVLEDGASTMIDALAFANNDEGWAGPQQTAFNNIVNAGHWAGTPDGGVGVNEPESADWSEGGEGKSLGRDSSSTDTNAKADWHVFTSHTPGEANPVLGNPGDVLINEAAPSEDEDWIEFRNMSGEGLNIQYWLVRERSTVVKTFPAYTAGPGEYFVLNFEGHPANDEIAGDTNGNGYRDFYATDSGLTGTDNVIILEDGASTMIDALAYANNNGTWAGVQQTAFNNIVEAGHWEGTVDGGAVVNEPECADWSNGAKGKSLGRDATSKDVGGKNDWYVSLSTKGGVNPGRPHFVTVTAEPASIPADDISVSTISAVVEDINNKPVADGTPVAFATDLGALQGPQGGPLSDATTETVDGVATVSLRTGTVPGKATVTAKSFRASGQVSIQLAFIPTQIGARIQLPAVDNEGGWETLIQVQNAGDEDTGAIVFFWGEYSGQCPDNDPGPIGVACMMIPENAVWTLRTQVPNLAKSAIVYSVGEALFGDACEDAVDAVDDSEDWEEWEDDYQNTGQPMAVIVQRQGPNDYDTMVASAYTGISEDMEGGGLPYQYFAPYAMRQYYNLDTEVIIQNSGQRCTSVWLYYQKQGGNCNFSHVEYIEQLAPGESARKRAPEALGVGWLGSIYITANEPLGIIVDQTSFLPSEDRGVLLTYKARPYKLTTDTLFYADLVWRELNGWDASIQVQNLTQESLPAFVTVEFFDHSGDSILFLGDWVCPAGGATFYLPAIAGLGVEYAGAAVIQSHSQVGYPSGAEIDGQPIFAVVDLKKAGGDAQGGSYNAYAESEKMGASVIMLPFLARNYQGVTSLIAVRNSSNCNDIKLKLEIRDETSAVVGYLGNFWLRAGHVKLMDLDSLDSVVSGFVGAGIAEITDVRQLCDTDGDGDVDQSPTMPSVVVVNKGVGTEGRSEAVTSVYAGIPAW